MKTTKHLLFVFLSILCSQSAIGQDLLTHAYGRDTYSLNGEWQYIVDPYETGFYDYRFKEKHEKDPGAYWNPGIPKDKSSLIEHSYSDKNTLNVPGDWNSQDRLFLYYEGTVWYKKSFDYQKKKESNRLFLYFGAVNYQAEVYLNGKKLGSHKGGFTPFQFEISSEILKEKDNFVVVKVDNKRHKDEVPTVNTDWWNYGGITRDVMLVETPAVFVEDYFIDLDAPTATLKSKTKKAKAKGWVKLNGAKAGETVTVEIPELKVKQSIKYTGEATAFSLDLPKVELWSDVNPKRYEVVISAANDQLSDLIGFRQIEVSGKDILLNGKPIFLRGICMHEEIATEVRRANSEADALKLLGWAKELNCNFVRLAHYPHNEHIVRAADSLGILLWSEIPVYWTIDFGNPEVLKKAKTQLEEMITRDRNRPSIIIWSVGNETPVSETRTEFMKELVMRTRELDDSRLVSAALEVHYNKDKNTIDDPLGAYTDIVSVNEYLGWYIGLPSYCETAEWETIYDKPLVFSETGAGAKGGFHADSLTRWSEEYQEWLYEEQVKMMKRMPDNYTGLMPWILVDFRSPKRNNPVYQEGWNRKGLIDNEGNKKKAFYVLQKYYKEIEEKTR
ncbi:glycoside hydrolase family 2 protein [Reichenbachiella ulvae]|uniref:Beta galactosidase jelly roll domain-containing protein n=1 Tax=Reichenbachiella ulvae TaxID=2980104 RepID=A0ABT3CWM9_9BACT|nr:glycoside hydrolase family 2 TIM barrel-domain containing protein [Reichenbachiella ulvae]MCV9387885.1 beta galactosidase jelly roll domain-containing protein [Reichenbachiella ulvae]